MELLCVEFKEQDLVVSNTIRSCSVGLTTGDDKQTDTEPS